MVFSFGKQLIQKLIKYKICHHKLQYIKKTTLLYFLKILSTVFKNFVSSSRKSDWAKELYLVPFFIEKPEFW